MNLTPIANQLKVAKERVTLIYAFNATGKTRLSVEYKEITRSADDGTQTGIYYNAFSEDLFVWDNDHDNSEQDIKLQIIASSLNQFHSLLTEDAIRDKLIPYKPRYDFRFNFGSPYTGIASVSFFIDDKDPNPIKISRGEERIFVWCFFLALFEVEGWADKQVAHFFIDDPVSSLDDHNIFVTAATICDLIEGQYEKRKIIITTHHVGLFSILYDWLLKGEKASTYKKITNCFILCRKDNDPYLENPKNDVFLYHLRLLQLLDEVNQKKEVRTYHFALLRQVLENIASFLGVGQFSYVLEQIEITDKNRIADIVNSLSHQKVYYYQTDIPVKDNLDIFEEVLDKLMRKYNFVLHTA